MGASHGADAKFCGQVGLMGRYALSRSQTLVPTFPIGIGAFFCSVVLFPRIGIGSVL